jgi:hypothetical protein
VDFFLFLLALIALTLAPVMIGARVVRAERTGFGSALLAVIFLTAFSAFMQRLDVTEWMALAIAAAGGATIFSLVLGTTLFRGLVVSILAVMLQIAFRILLAWLLM